MCPWVSGGGGNISQCAPGFQGVEAISPSVPLGFRGWRQYLPVCRVSGGGGNISQCAGFQGWRQYLPVCRVSGGGGNISQCAGFQGVTGVLEGDSLPMELWLDWHVS